MESLKFNGFELSDKLILEVKNNPDFKNFLDGAIIDTEDN